MGSELTLLMGKVLRWNQGLLEEVEDVAAVAGVRKVPVPGTVPKLQPEEREASVTS